MCHDGKDQWINLKFAINGYILISFEGFLVEWKARGLSPRTIDIYREKIKINGLIIHWFF